ncbi:hypothetical protein V9T40_008089 [Parthenolecanium corni]|uniref:Uncharacterized protein n=1 Tax=Parthenolecanium corni TaxID=536013 RepID=A0AAN9TTH4_9HEMI
MDGQTKNSTTLVAHDDVSHPPAVTCPAPAEARISAKIKRVYKSRIHQNRVSSAKEDAVRSERSKNVARKRRTSFYRCTKTTERHVVQERHLKFSRQHGCWIERNTISKCTVRANTLRITLVTTEIISANELRTYTTIDKCVQTSTFHKEKRSLSVRQMRCDGKSERSDQVTLPAVEGDSK